MMETDNRKISPDYYNQRRFSGVQYLNCNELIDDLIFSCSGSQAFYTGNIVKYLWRYRDKGNPVQDLKKAYTYMLFLYKHVRKNGAFRPSGFIGCSPVSTSVREVKNLLYRKTENDDSPEEKYFRIIALAVLNACCLRDRIDITEQLNDGLHAISELIKLYEE